MYKAGIAIGLIVWVVLAVAAFVDLLPSGEPLHWAGIVLGVLLVPFAIFVARQDSA